MLNVLVNNIFFFSSRRRHTRFDCDWSSDVCSSDLNDWNQWSAPITVNEVSPAKPEVDQIGTVVLKDLNSSNDAKLKAVRSEERRVGKECRCRWWTKYEEKKTAIYDVGAE